MLWPQRAQPTFRIEPYEARALDLALDQPLQAPLSRLALASPFGTGGRFDLCEVVSHRGGKFWVARARGCHDAPLLNCGIGDKGLLGILNDLRTGSFSRNLLFDAQGRLLQNSPIERLVEKPFAGLMFCTDGTATWDKEALPTNRNSFSWRNAPRCPEKLSARWRARTSDAQVAREVARMLADSRSDCAFSWRWMSLADGEKRRLRWKLARGSWDECEAILRALAWQEWPSQGEQQAHNTQQWRIGGPAKEPSFDRDFNDAALKKTRFWAGEWECHYGDWYHRNHQPSARQFELLRLAHHFFYWHLDPVWRHKTVISHRAATDTSTFEFEIASPTFHERIEATALLRELSERANAGN